MARGTDIIYDCKAETAGAAAREADKECTAVQQAVFNHCSTACGSCDGAVADEILTDCEIMVSDGSLARASAALAAGCVSANHCHALECGAEELCITIFGRAMCAPAPEDSPQPEEPSTVESTVYVVTYHVVPAPAPVAAAPVPPVPVLGPPPVPAPAPHVIAHQHSHTRRCTGPPPAVQDGEYTVQFGGTHATLRCSHGFVASTAGQTITCTSNVWSQPGGCVAPDTEPPAAVASDRPLRAPAASKQPAVSHPDQISPSEGSSIGSVFVWIGAGVFASFVIAYLCSELSAKNRATLLQDKMQKLRASDWNRDPERGSGSIYEPQVRGTVMWAAPAAAVHGSD